MPQIFFLLIVGAAAWMFYNKFVSDAREVTRRSEERQKEVENGAHGTLVQDPVTGEYRVRKDDA